MKNHAGYTNNKGVCFRYGISRTTLYRRIKKGRFPAPTGIAGKGNWWSNQALDDYDKKAEAGKPVVEVKNEVSANHGN